MRIGQQQYRQAWAVGQGAISAVDLGIAAVALESAPPDSIHLSAVSPMPLIQLAGMGAHAVALFGAVLCQGSEPMPRSASLTVVDEGLKLAAYSEIACPALAAAMMVGGAACSIGGAILAE